MAVFDIPIENILENPKNVRKDPGDLEELVNSIKRNGIRQNLIITPILDDDGEETDDYRLIAGHRRLAAAKKAHLISVPCRIERDLDESDEVMAMLEENMQRRNLSPMEEGQGVQMCLDLGISMEKLEHRTGLSEQTLKHRVEIAKLDPEVYAEKDDSFQLSIHAMYALEKIKDTKRRNEVLKAATDNQNLIWRANNAALEEKKEEYKAAIIRYLKSEGMFKTPKDVQTWTPGWKILGSVDYSKDDCGKAAKKLVNEIKETMKIDIMGEEVDYLTLNYGSMLYIMHKEKETEDPGDSENTVSSNASMASHAESIKKRDKLRKQMNDTWESWPKSIRKFCIDIIDGKYKCPKGKEPEILDLIWKYILDEDGIYICTKEISELYNDEIPDDGEETTEEFGDMVMEKVGQFTMFQSFIAILGKILSDKKPFTYMCEHSSDKTEEINDGISILENFGYSVADNDQVQLIDGSSHFYEEAANA